MADDTIDDDSFEDFTAYEAARREEEGAPRPPGFRLYGQTFVCDEILRAAPLLDMRVRSQQEGQTAGLLGFLQDTLTEDSWERFEVLFRDRTRPIGVETLDAIVGHVLKEYTARPTQESSSSPPTPLKRGRSSKGGSPSQAAARHSA